MNQSIFGERLAAARKSQDLSQDALAEKVEVQGAAIGRYERNEVTPSVLLAARMASELNVSLDYLVGNITELPNNELINRITEIQNLPEPDRTGVLLVIDHVIQNTKAKKVYSG